MRRLLGLALALTAVSCADPIAPGTADIVGVITVAPSDDARPRLTIAGSYLRNAPAIDAIKDFVVHVDGPIYETDASGKITPAAVADLDMNARVRIWTTGVEMQSLPPQVSAVRILIDHTDPNWR